MRPLSFVLPVYRGGPHRAITVAAGMLAYAALSGFRHSRIRMLDPDAATQLVPPLRTDGMVAAGLYEDAQTNDSRLVLATVTAAHRAGAVVVNHLPITGIEVVGGSVVAARAGDMRIRCRSIVNAAGPWVDEVHRMADPAAPPTVRLSKGVHVVLDRPDRWSAAVTTPLEGGRVTFAIPWHDMLLLGTTDSDYEGDPGRLRVEPEEVDQVLGEAAIALSPDVLARERIRFAFAGLRVLPRSAGSTTAVPRDEVVRTGPAGMVSVAGGKLTTHRRIARRVLREVTRGNWRFTDDPLPGARSRFHRAAPAEVAPDAWAHLTHLYGDEAPMVLEAGGFERVHPDGPDIWAQVEYAIDREWARTVEDVVRRRTTLAIRGLAGEAVRREVARELARRGIDSADRLGAAR